MPRQQKPQLGPFSGRLFVLFQSRRMGDAALTISNKMANKILDLYRITGRLPTLVSESAM
jgi:hypothetical protein